MNNFNAHFDGKTYDPALDKDRLKKQLGRVYDVMNDGWWMTLLEIQDWSRTRHNTFDPEASISARLRDLRKPKFGGYNIERRRRTNGTWEYRLTL